MNKTLVLLCLSLTAFDASATTVTIGNSSFIQQSQYVNVATGSPQIHVIGLYDGGTYNNAQGNYTVGTTQVNVLGSASGSVSLVLSSYELTNWVLTGPGVNSLTSVVLNGYHASYATGIEAGKVTNLSGPDRYMAVCAFAWPSDSGGCDTPGLISEVQSLFSTSIASFTGIYSTNPNLGTPTSLANPAAFQVNVQLSAVPIPPAVWLFGSALGLAGAMRRKISR